MNFVADLVSCRCYLSSYVIVMQGNILYRFPSLQRTAASQRSGRKEYVGKKWAQWVDGFNKYFEEKKWPFRLVFSMILRISTFSCYCDIDNINI